MRSRHRRPLVATALLGVATLLAAGCGNDSGNNDSNPPAAAQDTALHDQLPQKIKSAGDVKVATDASYPPNEFFDTDNKTIIGMDVELGNALGDVLGVEFKFANTGFDGIIPSVGNRFDLGMSSFTDNTDREKVVDMVTYFSAGTSLMVQKGNPAGITGVEALCGKKAAVEKGTTQLDDVTARSKTCKQAGKPAIAVQAFPDQNGANLALSTGRADVVLADSPVLDYAVKQTGGQFEITGDAYDTAPYGIAVPKGAGYEGFAKTLLAALQKVMKDGVYQKILEKWGITDGAISNPVINGANG